MVGLLGSTTATPSADFPRSAVLGWALAWITGLQVLSRPFEVGRVDEAGVIVGRIDEVMLDPLPLCSWRWMTGGSCFSGLSCTQKVCRLFGLTPLVVWARRPSLVSASSTNSSCSVMVSMVILVVSLFSSCDTVLCSWLASLWASWHTASSCSPVSGLQVMLWFSRGDATLTEMHFSLWLTGPTNTSSSSSSPLELQSTRTLVHKSQQEEQTVHSN